MEDNEENMHEGIWDICRKKLIGGIQDTKGKNYKDTGYLKKKYRDIQCEV